MPPRKASRITKQGALDDIRKRQNESGGPSGFSLEKKKVGKVLDLFI